MNEITIVREQLAGIHRLPDCFPKELMKSLVKVAQKRGTRLYIVGGTVRDWLLGRISHDLDLTVPRKAEDFCRDLIGELGGGTFVQLGTAEEEAARVVWRGLDVDVSAFRGGAEKLTEDLGLRDFSINGLAVDLAALLGGREYAGLIDPMGGLHDLEGGVLRHCPDAFTADPLRLLRAYRFMATLDFTLDGATRKAINDEAGAIVKVAAERVRYELDLIMQTERSAEVLWQMHEAGLLRHILPELYAGWGVEQPEFHHLDVFHHSFQALRELEQLLDAAETVYPGSAEEIAAYLGGNHIQSCLKWAALLHDIGKPATMGQAAGDGGRVTFYGHDEIGRKLFDGSARRLKWSNEERERTGSLIAMHMHPFHLCNVRREQGLSIRAAMKLCRRAGENLPGLFLLAMSDSLASRGRLKPEKMEDELVELYREVAVINAERIRPALCGPPLLGGRDLIDHFRLEPGPIFSLILKELQAVQIEGEVTTREEALVWVDEFVKKQGMDEKEACG